MDNAAAGKNMGRKVALVTGASSGLGRAVSIKLALAGQFVILAARSEAGLAETARLITAAGGQCLTVPTDVRQEESILALKAEADKIGFVSTVVNNAGVGKFARFTHSSTADWDLQMEVNLRGPYLVSRIFSGEMQIQKYGRIVFINSTAGLQPYTESAAYVASKHGLKGLADSLREELRKYNIKVISVFPGAFSSDFWEKVSVEFDQSGMMSCENVAEFVVSAILEPSNLVIEDIVLRRTLGDF
ncbi:MAG: SDR family oxidoreductase [FCB group bacterium]|nr:SDR family oxidoreductase [FCB group bacterium]